MPLLHAFSFDSEHKYTIIYPLSKCRKGVILRMTQSAEMPERIEGTGCNASRSAQQSLREEKVFGGDFGADQDQDDPAHESRPFARIVRVLNSPTTRKLKTKKPTVSKTVSGNSVHVSS